MRQEISATLEMYCEFLKTIPNAALLADSEGDIVWANQMAVALLVAQRMGFGHRILRSLSQSTCGRATTSICSAIGPTRSPGPWKTGSGWQH